VGVEKRLLLPNAVLAPGAGDAPLAGEALLWFCGLGLYPFIVLLIVLAALRVVGLFDRRPDELFCTFPATLFIVLLSDEPSAEARKLL